MVKCDKGFVEIEGPKNEVKAETAVLLRSLRGHISEYEFEEVIESSKKTDDEIKAEVRKAKKRIAEMLKEISFDEEDK